MRVATYNLQHGRSTVDGRVDVARLARAVTGLDADVLALQEVDVAQRRSRGADLARVARIAANASEHRFAPTMHGLPGLWRDADPRTVVQGRSEYGVALVSRLPVDEWRVVPLPRRPGVTWVRWGRVRRPARDEPRAAIAAVVRTVTGPVTVVGTHLSWMDGWNEHQLRVLLDETADLPRPYVLMGDLNLQPAAVARVTGLTPLAVAATYPVGAPVRQIDHVLGDGDVRAGGPAASVDTGLSDHNALVVDVTTGP
ncbi:endonuclease/exonuclease/phosphatase family protein [Cellulomonas sp. HZM]|uniref:endonuclease/exonuclease/phosphatase family protein n=1 Tax=Cellulomonas sp. HZM TaxID=1454010 RepID=UPI00049355F5|nr:endonuclease/exonuclease/phosphatase family protein [Cellulomonas sp. HZM]